MQTGTWITGKALNLVYGLLNNQKHVMLLCYKMLDILKNKTVLQLLVC